MPRRLRYQVAVSLDGFIAGPHGEYDWIVSDPSIDFDALYKEFDTVVMGRKTYEVVIAQGGHGAMPGLEVVVFSRSLPPATHPGVRIVNDEPRQVVGALKQKPGRDIWLFGGGSLFRSLLDARLVDAVELAVMPVLLGAGIPVLPQGLTTKLELVDHKVLPASGVVSLSYAVPGGVPGPQIGYIKAGKSRATNRTGRAESRKTAVPSSRRRKIDRQ
jgi:dihydrofolate reductase